MQIEWRKEKKYHTRTRARGGNQSKDDNSHLQLAKSRERPLNMTDATRQSFAWQIERPKANTAWKRSSMLSTRSSVWRG